MPEVRVRILGDAEAAARFQELSAEVIAAADKAAHAAGLVVEGFAKQVFRTVAEGGVGFAMGPPVPTIARFPSSP